MTFVNFWLIISDAAQDIVLEFLNWPEDSEYTGPLRPQSQRLFLYMDDHATRRQLFAKGVVLQSITYNMWNFELRDTGEVLNAVRDEIDYLIGEYPNQLQVIGSWRWNGNQFGDPPFYPIPDWAWKFMPPRYEDDGTLSPDQPSSNDDLIDVNLVQGQHPREFS